MLKLDNDGRRRVCVRFACSHDPAATRGVDGATQARSASSPLSIRKHLEKS